MKIFNFLQKHYYELSYLEIAKIKAAWFVSIICGALMVMMMFYTYSIDYWSAFISSIINIISFALSVFLIMKGKKTLVVWAITVPIYYTSWSNLIIGATKTIGELDAIGYVLIHAILMMLLAPKMVYVFFSLLNLVMGGVYIYLVTNAHPDLPFWDTFFDMYITILAVAVIGYAIVNINEKSSVKNLESLKNQKEANEKNEMILKTIENMITGLSSMVDNIEHIIEFLSDSSQSHAASIDEISASSEEVSSSSENIHDMTEKQNELISAIKTDIKKVLDIVTQTGQEMQAAFETKIILNKRITEAEKDLAESQQIIETLIMSFTEISKAAEVLEEIADDINLLSLNARIEAARSGLHGQGFAVVAEHIGLLANKTQGNAKEIGEVFKNNFKIISSVKDQLELLKKSFNSMIQYTKLFGDKIDIVANLAQQDYETTKSTNLKMETISELSEIINSSTNEQKLAMEESARSISDINAGVQQIANEAERLSTLSKQLGNIVNEMKNVTK